MPISGLLLTFGQDEDTAAAARRAIEARGCFQLNPPIGHVTPAVLDTPDRRADKRAWAWLNGLPGVRHVDVVFIHFEEEDALTDGDWQRRRPATCPAPDTPHRCATETP